jgi:hypothetical protein
MEPVQNLRSVTLGGNIDRSRLKRNGYTISLLNEAVRTGWMSTQEVYAVQTGLMTKLQELILRYTQGKSTSVTTDTAENLMMSIMYAVDACMLQYEHPETAVAVLKSQPVDTIYEQGVGIVQKHFEEAKTLYQEIKKHKLEVPVDAYNMTIDESLPVFMNKYGVIFDAHNTMASIDYPLAIDDMQLQGVFYMKRYLERLWMETQFCRLFDRQELLELLADYGKVCRFDYRIELFNIFRLVLNNAIFSVLSGGAAERITISPVQFGRLVHLFEDTERIDSLIQTGIERVIAELNIREAEMTEYIRDCRPDLVQRLRTAAEHNVLHTVIIMRKKEKPKSIAVSFHAADRMDDRLLRKWIAQIAERQEIGDKIKLIRSNFHSLHDYLDLLESDTLYGEEYAALFDTFGDMELAILAKIVFYEDLRDDFPDFPSIVEAREGAEREWQQHFIHFLRQLDRSRLKSIGEYVDDIDYEQITFV